MRRVFASLHGETRPSTWRGTGTLITREKEILSLFASGKSYAQIAAIKGNRPVTIWNAIYRIQDKPGADTKQEVVIWAVRNGLLDDMETSN